MVDGPIMLGVETVKIDRPADDIDGPIYKFVIATWLHNYLISYRRHVRRRMDVDQVRAYWKTYHAVVSDLLATTPIVLAYYAHDRDSFVGWACGEPGRLHWVYVKGGPWRRCGVASRLVDECAGTGGGYTFRPIRDDVAAAFERRGWIYTPIEIGEQGRGNNGRPAQPARKERNQGRPGQAPRHTGPIREFQRADPDAPGDDAEHARDRRVGNGNVDGNGSERVPDFDR